jgi:UDP-N-acetylglucosamine acyltransferase
MSNSIHPTAIIADGAKISANVSIGAYSLIGPHVVLAEGVKVHPHVIIDGRTTIGKETEIFPYVVIGMPPQSARYKGELSTIEIGENCLIREQVTIHPGTEIGRMKTTIGKGCQFMIGAHIGHDCDVGNFVTLANNATLGGHVSVGDYANIGGLAAIHQFTRIGAYAMIAGTAGVNEDVIPFGAVMAIKGQLAGINIIGMQRRGFERQDIHDLRNAYKLLAKNQVGTLEERLGKIKDLYQNSPAVKELLEFIGENPKRHLCLPSEDWEFTIPSDIEPSPRVACA